MQRINLRHGVNCSGHVDKSQCRLYFFPFTFVSLGFGCYRYCCYYSEIGSHYIPKAGYVGQAALKLTGPLVSASQVPGLKSRTSMPNCLFVCLFIGLGFLRQSFSV